MTLPFGLGSIESPPDERDYAIDQLYSAADLAAPLPATYRVPVLPSVNYNQGQTPMCVAFSAATEQASFDLVDQGHNYLWDEPTFFKLIGGTPNGAIIRNALDRRLHFGYPLKPAGSGNSQASHKIAAYYAVPKTADSIKRAILNYGVIVIGTPWFNSWFSPKTDGTLPPADYIVGGHAICGIGWNAQGLWLRNTWGKAYGVNGEVLMPWYAVLHSVRECWKAVDQKTGV